MKADSQFEDVFQQQLENLYDAERQFVEALPEMIAKASSEKLARVLLERLDQTREHVTRLEVIFGRMGEQPGTRKCDGLEGLLNEGERSIAEFKKSSVLDIALISTAQRVEHYQIASYGTACALAEMLAQHDAFDLLQATIKEERDAGESLSEIAEAILNGAAAGAASRMLRED